MTYFLCHKNIQVLIFKTENNEISEVCEILNKEHLPIGGFRDYEKGISKTYQFRQWWKNRSIPASRQNLKDALEVLGNITTEQLVSKSYGLSLSDHYWAKPINSNLCWENINFFDNDFSEDVGKALFGTLDVQDLSSISFMSPDNTSDGWLKKKWIIDNGERILLKGGSGSVQQEPFNEVLAFEICKKLKIPHVDYKIVESEGRYYSACKDFVMQQTELVSAWNVKNSFEKSNNESEYTHLINCCRNLGMKDIQEIEKQIANMLVLDCIIANEDRHFNNFGFIRNPTTLEWQGLAPIFDSGTSMFLNEPYKNLELVFALMPYKIKSKPFAKTHKEQLAKVKSQQFCKDLPFENLNDIENLFLKIFSMNEDFPEKRKTLLCNILKNRIKETADFINL